MVSPGDKKMNSQKKKKKGIKIPERAAPSYKCILSAMRYKQWSIYCQPREGHKSSQMEHFVGIMLKQN